MRKAIITTTTIRRDLFAFNIARWMSHLEMSWGPITLVLILSMFWMRKGEPSWWYGSAGGTWILRIGPLEAIYWKPHKRQYRTTTVQTVSP